jgi:hypothetical protein
VIATHVKSCTLLTVVAKTWWNNTRILYPLLTNLWLPQIWFLRKNAELLYSFPFLVMGITLTNVLSPGPGYWSHDIILFLVSYAMPLQWTKSVVLVRDSRLSAKLVPTFADRGCRMVSAGDAHGRILDYLDWSRYCFFQLSPQLYSQGWVDPRPTTSQKIW